MSESPKNNQNTERGELFRIVLLGACVCLILVLMYIAGSTPIKTYELGDSDCYMRLVRVSELYHSGKWYDAVISRSNAPYGERLHWTRPFDVLLLAGAVPLGLLTDFETALFWSGVVISPVLLIAAFAVLYWSVRPVLKGDGPFLVCFVFALQMIILTYFQPGRPDHHSLLLLLFILSVGFALRIILRPFNAVLCYTAGAVGALSVWVSVESLLPVCLIIAALGILWILKNADFAKKSLHYSVSLFAFMALSLILEKPWHDLAARQFDSLSIVHLGVLGFVAVFWIISSIIGRNGRIFQRTSHRFSFALAGAAAISIATSFCFPKFFAGPFADVDPRIIPIWLSKVSEVQPLISGSDSFIIPVQLLGSAVLSFTFLFYLLLKDRRSESRDGWLFISFAAVAFVLISLYQIRWSAYAQILLIIPMAGLMVLLRRKGPQTGLLKTLKNVSIVLVFSLGFLLLGLLADAILKKGDSAENTGEVSLIGMCDYLNDVEKWGQQKNLRILNHIDFGAEILYRTRYEVIGTPYHRNSEGILDTYNIMTADTDEKALEIIQERGINLILLCPESSESGFYSKPGHESTFYKKLCDDIIPDWLRKVEIPADLSSSFTLFETIKK